MSSVFWPFWRTLDKSVERQLQKGVKGALIPICLSWPISFMPNYLQPEMLLILSKIGSNIYLSWRKFRHIGGNGHWGHCECTTTSTTATTTTTTVTTTKLNRGRTCPDPVDNVRLRRVVPHSSRFLPTSLVSSQIFLHNEWWNIFATFFSTESMYAR